MSTQADIEETYDVANDFYRLFLDERMIYSCAVFGDEDNLELAQTNKLNFIADCAGVTPGMRVLDIGCGWGGAIDFLARERGAAHAVGITLSPAQYEQASRITTPGVEARHGSYLEYTPDQPFDAAISIGMFEHICTPEEFRSGKATAVYRDYFRRAWEWTRPGARFGLQSIVQLRIPRERQALRELAEVTYQIFPGAITPRVETIIASMNPYWEVQQVQMRRPHYQRTLEHWHERFRANEAEIRARWGDQRYADYDRYLPGAARAFENGYLSLAQFSLVRMDRAERSRA